MGLPYIDHPFTYTIPMRLKLQSGHVQIVFQKTGMDDLRSLEGLQTPGEVAATMVFPGNPKVIF